MSPELQAALQIGIGSLASGVTAVLANTRAVRRRVRKLERTVRALGGEVDTLQRGQAELREKQATTARGLAHAEKRLTWLMGAVHALLGALRLRGTAMPIALDAESTSAVPARAATKAG